MVHHILPADRRMFRASVRGRYALSRWLPSWSTGRRAGSATPRASRSRMAARPASLPGPDQGLRPHDQTMRSAVRKAKLGGPGNWRPSGASTSRRSDWRRQRQGHPSLSRSSPRDTNRTPTAAEACSGGNRRRPSKVSLERRTRSGRPEARRAARIGRAAVPPRRASPSNRRSWAGDPRDERAI